MGGVEDYAMVHGKEEQTAGSLLCMSYRPRHVTRWRVQPAHAKRMKLVGQDAEWAWRG